MKSATFESEHDDGLYGVAARAAAAVAGDQNDPVGLLEITRLGDEGERLTIEAVFAYRGVRRTIECLDARYKKYGDDSKLPERVVAEAVERFGSWRYTNLCISHSKDGEESDFDVTVCFASRFPYWATNMALIPTSASADELDIFADVLDALGVSHRRSRELVARDTQLRPRMEAGQQVAAFQRAREGGLTAALYSAALPATRSMRIRAGALTEPGQTGNERPPLRGIDCFLSLGLSGADVCTTADAWEMEDFMKRSFGVELAGKKWSVENVVADGPPVEMGRAAPKRAGVKFSLWVKGR